MDLIDRDGNPVRGLERPWAVVAEFLSELEEKNRVAMELMAPVGPGSEDDVRAALRGMLMTNIAEVVNPGWALVHISEGPPGDGQPGEPRFGWTVWLRYLEDLSDWRIVRFGYADDESDLPS
jgi:hypothetical protein